jgi:hypothetical protein
MNTDEHGFTEANQGNKADGAKNFRSLSKLGSIVVRINTDFTEGNEANKECQTTDEHR